MREGFHLIFVFERDLGAKMRSSSLLNVAIQINSHSAKRKVNTATIVSKIMTIFKMTP